MNDYLLPTDDTFVESIAKAIARNRLLTDAVVIASDMIDIDFNVDEALEIVFDPIFEKLWAGNSKNDEYQRKMYKTDAKVAIAAINLKLLTMTP